MKRHISILFILGRKGEIGALHYIASARHRTLRGKIAALCRRRRCDICTVPRKWPSFRKNFLFNIKLGFFELPFLCMLTVVQVVGSPPHTSLARSRVRMLRANINISWTAEIETWYNRRRVCVPTGGRYVEWKENFSPEFFFVNAEKSIKGIRNKKERSRQTLLKKKWQEINSWAQMLMGNYERLPALTRKGGGRPPIPLTSSLTDRSQETVQETKLQSKLLKKKSSKTTLFHDHFF